MDRSDVDRPERRTALIGKELARCHVDIAALSETRRANEGKVEEAGSKYTFFWKGKPEEDQRIHGVGFAIKTKLVNSLNLTPVNIHERLMYIRVPLKYLNYMTIISAYAPTLDSTDDVKETFYTDLTKLLWSIPKTDKVVLLGDFNARIGSDYSLWAPVLGKHGIGKCNANGLLLLGLCTEHSLSIANTYFRLKTKHKTTWMHPRSRHWHQIDFAITRTRDLKDFMITKAIRSIDDCWTDHRLLLSKLRIQLRQKKRGANPSSRKRVNVKKLLLPETAKKFENSVLHHMSSNPPHTTTAADHWISLKDAIHESAKEHLGFVKVNQPDWFNDNDTEISSLIDEKRQARLVSEDDPTSKPKRNRYREAKAKSQRRIREIQNNWWVQKARELQTLADKHHMREFFRATKEIYGPTPTSSAPLKSEDESRTLVTAEEIKERWAEHFSTLLNRPSTADEEALNQIPQYPTRTCMDQPPSLDETIKAIKQLRNNKATGPDNIPAEIYKYGGQTVQANVHNLLLRIWETATIPSDLKDCIIVTIHKKGDKSICGNYRGISLLATAGKILARILLNRLLDLAEEILPESQYGFRSTRSTVDAIFCARQLQEKAREQNRPFLMTMFDLSKAFDSVPREALWRVLQRFGCPAIFMSLVRGLHDGMTAKIMYKGQLSPAIPIKTGVKQGCVLAPTMFSMYLAALLRQIPQNKLCGIQYSYRTDGSLFNLSRLKTKSKTTDSIISEIQYADDNGTPSDSPEKLQILTNAFVTAYELFGLSVNTTKTKVLVQEAPQQSLPPFEILIHNQPIEQVSSFQYLGSILHSSSLLEQEVNSRIRAAHHAFGKLSKRVFYNCNLRLQTKLLVYNAVVLPTLMYASESWTPKRCDVKPLEAFHQRKLRLILGVKWEDRITNQQVLVQTSSTSMETLLLKQHLRWAGHLQRMEDNRVPKQLLYGELSYGKRNRGGPKKRFKDHLRNAFKKTGITEKEWTSLAKDRNSWRKTIHDGSRRYEAELRAKEEERRKRRKEREDQRLRGELPPPTIPCEYCDRFFYSHLGKASHLRSKHRR